MARIDSFEGFFCRSLTISYCFSNSTSTTEARCLATNPNSHHGVANSLLCRDCIHSYWNCPCFGKPRRWVLIFFIQTNNSYNLVQETFIKYSKHCEGKITCDYEFNLPSDYTVINSLFVILVTYFLHLPFQGDIYFYYYLENFYQNHRRYVKSRNDQQYLGNLKETTDCAPFEKVIFFDTNGLD